MMIGRRGVLTGAAGLAAFAMAGGAYAIASAGRTFDRKAADLRAPFDPDEETVSLVRFATLAANSHNTQPWLFRREKDAIFIRPDVSRRTPVVDPDDHHLHVSLGCAAENLAIAATASGRPAEIDLADGGEGLRVALASDGQAGGQAGRRVEADLFAAIPARQTTRSVYDGHPVRAEDVAELEKAVRVEKVRAVFVTERRAMSALRDLVIAANTAQMQDRAFMRELKAWIRFSPQMAMARADGLYAAASGNATVPDWLGNVIFDFVVTAETENEKYAAQIDGSAGLVVFFAEEEGPAGWAAVGRACQRFQLTATTLGLKTAFVNQPVEVADFRDTLAAAAGEKGLRPDLLMRFGRGPDLPFSMRRPVDTVLET